MAKQAVKSIEIPSLPPVVVLATGQTIVPAAEKAQIESISVEKGKPGTQTHSITEIYSGKDFVQGLNPVQGQFIFNLVTGGLGSGRGDRPTAFANWAVQVFSQMSDHPFFRPLSNYNVIVEYGKRGGTMVYPVEDLLAMCEIKARNTQISHERFPPERKVAEVKTRKTKTADVSLTL